MSTQTQWSPDVSLAGYEATTLHFPDDYNGEVVATLVRRKADIETRRAVLYIHGFVDYFFQPHLAEAYNQHGYNFYALDLRKYGRSLRDEHRPNYCKSIEEYFAEISAALRIITEEDGHEWVLLNGHSTGGLTASLYADSGELRDRIDAVYLNSPFFQLNFPLPFLVVVRALAALATIFPYLSFQLNKPLPYFLSIHKDHHGEWDFDLRWRPLNAFPVYSGWCRAISRAHKRVENGLNIQCPVLVMHADKSIYGETWEPKFQTGDAVLGVDHIKTRSKYLGSDVKIVEIENGLHDLVLSASDVRQQVFDTLFEWLDSLPQ